MSTASPRCEVCSREPATSFSWFADETRWYAPRSGTWRFTGACTSESESYYVLLRDRGRGWLESAAAREDWRRHLGQKVWFDSADWCAMVARFWAASRKGHRARRLRPNLKPPAGRLRELPRLEARV